MYRNNYIRPIGLNLKTLFTFITILSSPIIISTHTKPYKSHRCLDWNFGGWAPMFSLQPPVSEPIYHRPQIQTTHIHHPISSANYVKKLKDPIQSWLPYAADNDDRTEAKVVRYNVRHPPSKYRMNGGYPKYPHYLPTTVLRLKKARKNNKLNLYSVPMNPYSIKNIYQSPIIYQQLDYPITNAFYNKKQPNTLPHSISQQQSAVHKSPKQQKTYTMNHKPTISHKSPGQPRKKTIAAYIPILEIPAIDNVPTPIEKTQPQKIESNYRPQTVDIKKPNEVNYQQKIVQEHVYQIPNHLLHEIRHEVMAPHNTYSPSPPPQQVQIMQHHSVPIQNVPIHSPQKLTQQSYGPSSGNYLEYNKPPQIVYEINYNPGYQQSNYQQQQQQTHYKPSTPQMDGPPIFEISYPQMDNYAKAEDSGLFKPFLDKTRQENAYPKFGAMPYKDTDPENLNVIHLIANQKHLPMIVPITSIHTSKDGSYTIEPNEGYPIMEKEISSYSERPYNSPLPQYSPSPIGKNAYAGEEKVIVHQLHNIKSIDMHGDYKEPQYIGEQVQSIKETGYIKGQVKEQPIEQVKVEQPHYVIQQTYGSIKSMPDVQPPLAPQPEISQPNYQEPIVQQIQQTDAQNEYQQLKNEYSVQSQEMIKNDYPVQQQEIKTVHNYPAVQIQHEEVKTNYPASQKQEIKTVHDYPAVQIHQEPIIQIKEQPITQIQQITTEYVKKEQPKQQSYVQQQEQNPIQVQEVIVKENNNYPVQDYQIKQDYGVRIPTVNYQYVKPTNMQQQSYDSYNSQPEVKEQSYTQQIENQKPVVQSDVSVSIKDEELANIAAYEEARKAVIQPISYSVSSEYQQPIQQSYNQQQSYDDGQYHSSYQPPLSTAYESPKEKQVNDYADDYSSNYDSNSQYRVEEEATKGQTKTVVDKVYDLPSNTAEKVIVNNGDHYNIKEEVLTSEEQTNKKYQEPSPVKQEKSIAELNLNQKSESGQKYGERLVYVKAKKYKNLKMIRGDTYLGDVLLYSASMPSNSTVSLGQTIDDKLVQDASIKADNQSSSLAYQSTNTSAYTVDSIQAKVEPIKKFNLTTDDLSVSNGTSEFVKPVSRSDLRRIRRLRKEEKSDELAVSASEINEKMSGETISNADSIDLNGLKEEEDLKAEDSELFHAYYASPEHQPEEGYVRLTVEQFKKIFKNAEIHVLNQDLKSFNSTELPPNNSTSITTIKPAQ